MKKIVGVLQAIAIVVANMMCTHVSWEYGEDMVAAMIADNNPADFVRPGVDFGTALPYILLIVALMVADVIVRVIQHRGTDKKIKDFAKESLQYRATNKVILSNVVITIAFILMNIMCIVVGYNYSLMHYEAMAGFVNSMPASSVLLMAVPFLIGIAICIVVSTMLKGNIHKMRERLRLKHTTDDNVDHWV